MLISTFQCTECGGPIRGSAGLGLCGACALRGAIDLRNSRGVEEAANERGRPRRFGDYDLLEELARGGMGVVYRARQRSLAREVALKVLLGGAFAGEDGRRRLRAEAAAAGRLQHPNIVAVHDAGVIDGQPFFSMTLVEGPTLADVARAGALPATRAARYVARIAEAVHYAHTQGVLHRDLKPSNVILDANDEPHVTDFGLAKQLVGMRSTASVTPSENMVDEVELVPTDNLTVTGQVLGSPAYMPPEQATGRSRELGPATDVYSLGAILYELLTGRPPFLGETAHTVIEQVKTLDPIPIRRLKPGIPADLETVCLKCLEKEPRRRYASAQELADDLTRFLDGEMVRARPVGPAGRLLRMAWRRPWRATAVMLAAAMLAGTGVALAWKVRTEHLHSIALLKEQAATRLAMMRSQLGETHAIIRLVEADSRPRAEAILSELLKQNPPDDLRAQARDFALAALALPAARTEPLLGDGIITDDWTLAAGDLPRERWALAAFRGKVVLRPVHAATNALEFSTSPRVISALIGFSSGGRWLAIRHREELGIWDTTPGATQRLAFVAKPWAKGVAFSFSATAFAPDESAVLWLDGKAVVATSLPGGRQLARWQGAESGDPKCLTFAPDGRSFAVAQHNRRTVELRSWPTGELRQKFSGPFPQELSAIALTTHADWIAGGDLTGRITVWRGDGSLKPVLEFRGHTEGIRALKFSDDGRHLASTSEDGSLRLWDCVTGAAVVAAPYDGAVVSFAPDGHRMGVGQTGGKLSVLHLEPSPILHRFRPLRPPETPQMVAMHPDGHSLFCLAEGGVVRCSVPDGTPLNFFAAHGARSLLPEPPGEHDGLVVGGPFGLVRFSLTDLTKSSVLFKKADSGWRGVSASADGRWLAANDTMTGRVAVWPAGDKDNARAKFFRDTPMLREETALSPDGAFVATHGFYDPGLIIFDVAKGTVSRHLPLPPRHATAWSPDGRWFAGMGSTFTLWNTSNWEPVALPALEPNVFPSTAVVFSWPMADGRSRYLATVTGTSRVALIAMATRTIVATLEAPQPRAIYKLIFSRDGHWLAAALAGGEIQLWDLPVIQSRLQSGGFGLGRE